MIAPLLISCAIGTLLLICFFQTAPHSFRARTSTSYLVGIYHCRKLSSSLLFFLSSEFGQVSCLCSILCMQFQKSGNSVVRAVLLIEAGAVLNGVAWKAWGYGALVLEQITHLNACVHPVFRLKFSFLSFPEEQATAERWCSSGVDAAVNASCPWAAPRPATCCISELKLLTAWHQDAAAPSLVPSAWHNVGVKG